MSSSAQWSDLAPRVLSGLAMVVAGIAIVWTGGWIAAAAVWGLGGVMMWEAARMFGAPDALRSGIAAAVVLALVSMLPPVLVLPLLIAAVIVAATKVQVQKPLFMGFGLWIMVGAYVMALLVGQAKLPWILWLLSIVVISDVAGYFAGRLLGGPKFWPRISPKKTWSGTVAGWIGAALIGAVFAAPTQAGIGLVVISVLVGFAGQMGDIIESAVKRRTGVKDSSNIIPGHGGVLDRFDAMLGAAALVAVFWLFGFLPGLT